MFLAVSGGIPVKLGVALPVEAPGLSSSAVLDWARRIEAGPFDTIAIVDEIVSPNVESLVTLAAVAAVTSRVRLMTVVIASPVRNTALLAKQAATIDALSDGRLSLGLGVGELVDDFAVSGVEMRGRGELFEQQLTELRRIWNGEPVGETGRRIGPAPAQPGGPELLIGGWADRAVARIGRYADGYVGAAITQELASDLPYRIALEAWEKEGRPGRPRFVQNVYFALGEDAISQRDDYLRYAYEGSPGYDLAAMSEMIPATNEEIRMFAERMEALGVDELNFHSISADIDQISRLEQALQ
jgi:alkanesulfonate monooxygenase SsuD/methylene tetrahydromethanopterin reductase-like flavin-dependent oxidoreductase (luciferase family)